MKTEYNLPVEVSASFLRKKVKVIDQCFQESHENLLYMLKWMFLGLWFIVFRLGLGVG